MPKFEIIIDESRIRYVYALTYYGHPFFSFSDTTPYDTAECVCSMLNAYLDGLSPQEDKKTMEYFNNRETEKL